MDEENVTFHCTIGCPAKKYIQFEGQYPRSFFKKNNKKYINITP